MVINNTSHDAILIPIILDANLKIVTKENIMVNSKLMVIINVKSSMKCMKGLHVVIFPCDFFFCNLLIIKVLLQT